MKTYIKPSEKLLRELCVRPGLDGRTLSGTVEKIFSGVVRRGDAALLDYTAELDGVRPESIELPLQEIQTLAPQVPQDLKKAIDEAYKNIGTFHAAQKLNRAQETAETLPGVLCWRESRPIEKVGLYVPGGSAPLFSTVLMLGVPAQLAGCREIVLCTPPTRSGTVEPAICYAALKCGITKLVRVGGAQAIAALAVGTASVPKVDKIFGPGNQYVTVAKSLAQKFNVAIDFPAGPSEVMIVADSSAKPNFVAADLLSQAEHGPDSQVVLATDNESLVKLVQKELQAQLRALPRYEIAKKALANSFCVILEDLEQVMQFANLYAPEHLILNVKSSKRWAKAVANAGSVFLGGYSPESAGDYASGTNHTLPTSGWARSYGGLSLDSFVKKITFQSLSKAGLKKLAPTIQIMAEAEGLEAHKLAVSVRLNNKL